MKVNDVVKVINPVLPVIISIKYDDGQTSLRSCKNADELRQYAEYRLIGNSETILTKEVNQITYIDAMTAKAYLRERIRERNKNNAKSKKEKKKGTEDNER